MPLVPITFRRNGQEKTCSSRLPLSENKGTKAMLRYLLHILVVGTIAIIVLAATAFANSAVPSSVTAIDATPKRGLL